jgi:hypothetical protein
LLKRTLHLLLCFLLLCSVTLTGLPLGNLGHINIAEAEAASVTKSGNTWTVENEMLRAVITFTNGSIELTSFFNKQAGKEYLTGSGGKHLFYYNYGGSDLYANDGGWTLGADTITDIAKFGTTWGKTLQIPLTRTNPQSLTVTLTFEIYNDQGGLKYNNYIQNNSSEKKTIANSDIIALNFPNEPHTLHYVPNMTWFSTTGSLAPNVGRNAMVVYTTGDGWAVQPEMNWKTQGALGRLPFANINAWSGIPGVKVSTNAESLQLVLFPGERFEYLSVNMTVFKGDILDGKMAMEEHFRKRFKYHDVTSIAMTNDWDWLGNRTEAYYRNTVIPKAVQAGMDMIMLDDFWNTTRDTTTPASSFTNNLQALTDTIVGHGMRFGLWFSMTGDNHNLGRDLADPANIEFKRSQVEDFMIPQYHLSHQMIDLTEFWPNPVVTSTSHPSDSVYRKNVLVRNYLNDLVSRHPDFIGKLTSEVDIYPTQGDRNIGLLHMSDNGFVSSKGDVDKKMKIAMYSFGYLPMNSVYYGGSPTGKMQDYFPLMLARVIKFNTDPGTWNAAGVDLLRKFNDWRKSPRILALTNETTRPLYAGPNYDTNGPYAWMYRSEDKSRALVIATTAGETGAAKSFTVNMRWLDDNKTYLVEDITLDDNGTSIYKFKGRFTGAQLKSPGFTIDLTENTSEGKAYWLQEDNGSSMQVLYADEKITAYTTQAASASGITVNASGAAGTTGQVVVFDRAANTTEVSSVTFGSNGTGSVTIESGVKTEAESMTATVSAGDSVANGADSAASGGSLSYANLNAVGDWVQYKVNVPAAGTYQVKVRVKKHPSRGTAQLYIDGAPQGSPIDEYASTQGYAELDLGTITFSSAGEKLFKFQITGKNAGSSGYGLATDYVRLTERSPDIMLPPPVPEPTVYEAEKLSATVSPGDVVGNGADTGASGGVISYGNLNAAGDWVQYMVNVPSPGTYNVHLRVKKHPSRGMAQLHIDGQPQGDPIDEYAGTQSYVDVDMGLVTFQTAGDKAFKLQSVGKNASSSGYGLATDYIKLSYNSGDVTMPPPPAQTTKFEAESLTAIVSPGDAFGNGADTAASGGSLSYANLNAVGDWIEYSVNVPAAGTYGVKVTVKKHPSRGMAQLYIDGSAQGSPIDEYQSTQGYATLDLGNATFSTAGVKSFKFQITGKHAASTGYGLATDYVSLTWLDQTPPTITGAAITEPNEKGWYNGDVVVQFACKDDLSGVASCTSDQTITGEGGDLSVEGLATDIAGHQAKTTVGGIRIDKTAPVTTAAVSLPDGKNGWHRTDPMLTLNTHDSLSGVSQSVYSLNGGAWAVYNGPVRITMEGSTKVEYKSVDQAGNVEPVQSVTVRLDKTAPTLRVQLDKMVLWTPNHKLHEIFSELHAEDAGSGIDATVLSEIRSSEPDQGISDDDQPGDIQSAELGTADRSFQLRAERSGTGNGRVYTIVYTAYDRAGNQTSASATVTVPHSQGAEAAELGAVR